MTVWNRVCQKQGEALWTGEQERYLPAGWNAEDIFPTFSDTSLTSATCSRRGIFRKRSGGADADDVHGFEANDISLRRHRIVVVFNELESRLSSLHLSARQYLSCFSPISLPLASLSFWRQIGFMTPIFYFNKSLRRQKESPTDISFH